jgi:hypothetical protein
MILESDHSKLALILGPRAYGTTLKTTAPCKHHNTALSPSDHMGASLEKQIEKAAKDKVTELDFNGKVYNRPIMISSPL